MFMFFFIFKTSDTVFKETLGNIEKILIEFLILDLTI